MSRLTKRLTRSLARRPLASAAVAAGLALGALAIHVRQASRRAEAGEPPRGEFAEIDGVRVHYRDQGEGPPVLLLHGNGAMAEDYVISGLFGRLAKTYRVIAPDRPGFGYTERPRDRLWTPAAQAKLIDALLVHLGISQAIVVGHSWGTLVALALALDTPASLRGLVLLGGYYYPTARLDVVLSSGPALPIVGDLTRHTISPVLGKAMAPAVFKKLFAPRPVPARFKARFPTGLALRPDQIRAVSEDTVMMIPGAAGLYERYGTLDMPVAIMAGAGDEIVTPAHHAERLHQDVPGSDLHVVPGIGHMIHYAAIDRIAQAVDRIAER